MSRYDPYEMPVWFKIYIALVLVSCVLTIIAAATGWDPLRLLGDPVPAP